ncbi:nuclear transport factor 2 family protein [uncultured Fibrella sp.]|uniref:nuclear transport factor 2 family protein n=1 Tax=uncultured Fibrella sp. TaxID=1284596 RepID=UPI0035CBB6B0
MPGKLIRLLARLLLLLLWLAGHLTPAMAQSVRPVANAGVDVAALAQAEVKAYNAHDIEAFLATYSDSATIYTYPDKVLARGKTALRILYGSVFKLYPTLRCEVVHRVVQGHIATAVENTHGVGKTLMLGVGIYTFGKDGKITEVRFIE